MLYKTDKAPACIYPIINNIPGKLVATETALRQTFTGNPVNLPKARRSVPAIATIIQRVFLYLTPAQDTSGVLYQDTFRSVLLLLLLLLLPGCCCHGYRISDIRISDIRRYSVSDIGYPRYWYINYNRRKMFRATRFATLIPRFAIFRQASSDVPAAFEKVLAPTTVTHTGQVLFRIIYLFINVRVIYVIYVCVCVYLHI